MSTEESRTGLRIGHVKRNGNEITVNIGRSRSGGEIKNMNNTEVGEPGWLGNPYPLDDYSRRDSVQLFIDDFEERLNSDQEFREAVKDLDGEIAGCWCRGLDENKPLCHGDAIRAVVEDLNSE